jgi:hypothetical protein
MLTEYLQNIKDKMFTEVTVSCESPGCEDTGLLMGYIHGDQEPYFVNGSWYSSLH